MGFVVWELLSGFGVLNVGFRKIWGLGFRAEGGLGVGFRIWGSQCRLRDMIKACIHIWVAFRSR